MKEIKDYYIGLDIGTNSVGWAVTDREYNLCKFNGKSMWGIRLFEPGKTAEERRLKRANRRRLQRKKQRIDLLQELFAEEMFKVDPTFFIRLNESRLHLEDKSTDKKFPLFIDKSYTDIDFYKEYPTIFHLRKELIGNSNAHDIRLVYLALHHILKTRGHFLIEGDLGKTREFKGIFNQFISEIENKLGIKVEACDAETFEKILRDKNASKSNKAKELAKVFKVQANDENPTDKTSIKEKEKAIIELCKLVVGNKGDVSKLFDAEITTVEGFPTKFSFSEATYEDDKAPKLQSVLAEDFSIIEAAKSIYDWSILVDIMDGEEYLSYAKVKSYNKHKANLKKLKYLLKKYCEQSVYKDFFDGETEKGNYPAYIGRIKTNGKEKNIEKCTEEEFYKNLKNKIGNIEGEITQEDIQNFEEIKKEVENWTLLPRQRSKNNGTIPKQVHEAELAMILENAKTYLPFLSQKDDKGISAAEKIIKIFNFRIPYYVGPLSTRHQEQGANVWIERKEGKEGERIYPWNFDEIVDREGSNEKFIKRMTNKCTYLLGKDVIPKNSLLYKKYMVLNELNNLKIRNEKPDNAIKQSIYRDLFETKARVTGKALLNYLRANYDSELTETDLSGFDKDFKANLSSYLDFKKQVFAERMAEDHIKKIVEDIIEWKTIYGDDWKMIKDMIEKEYPNELTEEQLSKIKNLKYSGWGNFSKEFLTEIEGAECETGEIRNIVNALWETNNNLMQLLSEEFTYKDEIERINKEEPDVIGKLTYENVVEDLYVSPAVKRAIWQSLQIVEEIKKVQKTAPKKIFVELARGEEEKKRTKSRKDKLIDLYKSCKSDTRDWVGEIEKREERDFSSMKLYLYYIQMGKCMYSGENIDIESLMSANSKWDRDHIYPQAKVKDDSIDNLVLANKTYNSKKGDGLIPTEWQRKQKAWWTMLLQKGFISQKKYERLTRREDFSPEDLGGFISRQLVETRQSSKAVVELLKRVYEEENTRIIPVKAGITSDFRRELGVLKSRRINDYHHAKDAYLNIVSGDVYDTKYTSNPVRWAKAKVKAGEKIFSVKRVFDFDVKDSKGEIIWYAPEKDREGKTIRNENGGKVGGSFEKIRRIAKRNDVLYTEYTYCEKGELFNQTIQKKKDGLIPIKKGLDTVKYGGYTSANTSYFALIEFDGKKGERVRNIMEVPIYIANRLPQDPSAYEKWLSESKGLKNVKVLRAKIKKNALFEVNGYPMRIRGANEKNVMLKNNIQLVLNTKEETIRKIEKFIDKYDKNGKLEVNEEFDKITREDVLELYDEFILKLRGTYKARPSNQAATLESNRENFLALTLTEKVRVLNQILTMLRCDTENKANLEDIGGSKFAGSMVVNKNTLGKSHLMLVNQSVTGLFENRIEL